MSTASARAYQPRFAGRFVPFEMRKSPQNKAFYGHWSTYPGKAHCIKDSVLLDPCMGSGHILCYLFDVLMQIYEAYGYTSRDAVSSIVRNNLYGLDIDDRAAQLAYFSVMMKACQYDKRFLTRGVQPHVYVIMESNGIDPHCVDYFTNGKQNLKSAIDTVLSDLHDAKEYGSILNTTQVDFSALYARFDEIRNENPSMHTYGALNQLLPLIQVAEAMAQEYHVVVTNPPYMSSKGMNAKMTNFVKSNFPDSCTDLFSVFIEQCKKMTLRRGFYSMITMHNWMYIDSFLKLRKKIINNTTLISLIHLGIKAFEFIGNDVVQTCC